MAILLLLLITTLKFKVHLEEAVSKRAHENKSYRIVVKKGWCDQINSVSYSWQNKTRRPIFVAQGSQNISGELCQAQVQIGNAFKADRLIFGMQLYITKLE